MVLVDKGKRQVPNIDWEEYKEFRRLSLRDDKFVILLDFLKSYYNITNPYDVFDSLQADELGLLMMQKREIEDAQDLERFMRSI